VHFVVKLVDGNPATGFPGTTGLASKKIPNRRVRADVRQTLPDRAGARDDIRGSHQPGRGGIKRF